MLTHPRVSLSMLSQWNWTVDEDLAFFDREGVRVIGLSLAKLEAAGGWSRYVERVRGGGYRVTNLIGIGPFQLADRAAWESQRGKVRDALDAAYAFGAECVVLTTGPAAPLTWEDAADAYAEAMTPIIEQDAHPRGIRIALEHTNSLRVDIGFLHTLRDAIDLARRLGVGVCMEINACWAERGLGATIADGIDTITIVQLSDFAVGTMSTPNRLVPGDGDIPMERIVGQLLEAGYGGVFDIEMIGPRIEEEGYERASRRAVEYVSALLGKLGA
jgi:sugar phosphate isomerase/epimerase